MARGKARGKDRHGPGRMEEEGGGGEAWLATYADAITLLMAFFMMLYAMSQIDQVKFEGLIAGFAVPFGNDNGNNQGQDLLEAGSGLVGDLLQKAQQSSPTIQVEQPFDQVEQSFRDPITIEVPPPAADGETAPEGAVDASSALQLPPDFVTEDDLDEIDSVEITQDPDGLPILAANQLAEVKEALRSALSDTPFEDDVFTVLSTHGLIVTINADDVLFASGSAELRDGGREVLDILGPVLADFGNEVLIEGHTDDVPLRRGAYSNWNLSTDRAIAVVNHLSREHALAQRRLAAIGYGEFRPKVPNETDANRALNRRVEIVIIAGGT